MLRGVLLLTAALLAVGTVPAQADLSGYYATDRGDAFYPYSPLRVWDTRIDSMPLGAGDTAILGSKRWFPPALTSMMVNVTAADATTDTYFTPYPADAPRPDASMLDVGPGETVPAMTVVGVSPGSKQAILYNHVGVVDMIVDMLGYFAPPSRPCATACPVSWGDDYGGVLGNGAVAGSDARPNQVFGPSGVAAITGSMYVGLALGKDGGVWEWGSNVRGYSIMPVPTRVDVPAATAIAVGDGTSYALGSDGLVRAWGVGDKGQTGNADDSESLTPQVIPGLTGVTAIAAGGAAGYAVRSDGTVWGWGDDRRNQLGRPVGDTLNIWQLDYLSGVTAIGAGAAQSYAVIG